MSKTCCEYDNKPIKHRNEQRYNKYNNKETTNVCEFAGMISHHIPYCWTCTDHQNRNLHKKHQKNLQNHNISLNHIQDIYQSKLNHQKSRNHTRNICHNKTRYKTNSSKQVSNHIYNKFSLSSEGSKLLNI